MRYKIVPISEIESEIKPQIFLNNMCVSNSEKSFKYIKPLTNIVQNPSVPDIIKLESKFL